MVIMSMASGVPGETRITSAPSSLAMVMPSMWCLAPVLNSCGPSTSMNSLSSFTLSKPSITLWMLTGLKISYFRGDNISSLASRPSANLIMWASLSTTRWLMHSTSSRKGL